MSFPQRALFDKIGIRTMVLETDPFGNFLTQGYEFGSGRDWARLGNLYLQDGVWNGERHAARGLREVREHSGASVGRRRAPHVRRLVLDQRRGTFPVPKGRLLHVRCRRADRADHPLASPRRRAPGALQGRGAWWACLSEGRRHVDGRDSSCFSAEGASMKPRALGFATMVITMACALGTVTCSGPGAPGRQRDETSATAGQSAPKELPAWQAQAQRVTIVRDDWGIPHVRGRPTRTPSSADVRAGRRRLQARGEQFP